MDAVPEYPCLRPVEAIPDPERGRVVLRDPTQLASGILVVGVAELTLLSLLDGRRSHREIQGEYARQTGQLLFSTELEALLEELGAGGFLGGPPFEGYYEGLAAEYLQAPYRPLRDRDGFGAPAKSLGVYLDRALEEAGRGGEGEKPPSKRLAGLVTPHLDFPRGLPCYRDGYAALRRHEGSLPSGARRVVILGTNHFGRSRSVVATSKDFETPWGVVPTDRPFLERLQAECGGSLAPYELDHLREHSIELQAVWLHHLFGDRVRIVPFLCPDPSGPRGTRAGDAEGVDLREFALALGHLVRQDPTPTLLVASADLSHVGRYFGDEKALDERFLRSVRRSDGTALAFVDGNEPEPFRLHVAGTGNPTRVCSVGCLYALMVALGPEAEAQRLRYHQAVTEEIENCVTSAAYAFYA
jgi:AmmeMemoRadiSam system protein B